MGLAVPRKHLINFEAFASKLLENVELNYLFYLCYYRNDGGVDNE